MILKIYSIKDNIGGFYQPTFEESDQHAIRNFAFAVNKKDGLLYANANDFSLYYLGELDTKLGRINAIDPTLLVQASSLIGAKNE